MNEIGKVQESLWFAFGVCGLRILPLSTGVQVEISVRCEFGLFADRVIHDMAIKSDSMARAVLRKSLA